MVFPTDNFLLGADDFNWEDDMELTDRAKECARCIQLMAVENPLLFSNHEKLSAWFETLLKHEQQETPTPDTELLAAAIRAEKILSEITPADSYEGHPLEQLREAIAKHSGREG